MTAILPNRGNPARRGTLSGTDRTPGPTTLELLEWADRAPADRRRRARLTGVLVLIVVAAALFGLVASHVALTQGQFRLQRLRERAAVEQSRYERLRLQVAELESPARVVAAAQERLGMVPPPGVTYLSPAGPASGAPQRARSRQDTASDDWSTVKRQLASRR